MRVALLAAFVGAVGVALAGPANARPCAEDVEVVGAQATFRTHMLEGKPTRRDVDLRVTVRSTATSAISAVELAVFLGAKLADVDATRIQALPTRRPRHLKRGGLAFRSEVDADLPPGATRILEFGQTGLPLDRDVYGVSAKVVRCRRLIPVGSATIALPPKPDPWLPWLSMSGMMLAALAGAIIIIRLR